MFDPMSESLSPSLLKIRGLDVHYGAAHVLQGIDLDLTSGIHAVIGRNGMGKTTLCNALMGLIPASAGEVVFQGANILGQPPHKIANAGIGYTPQGRRLWKSLTVDEHLRLGAKKGSRWSIERIYDTFPRLAERKSNGGAALSGGEQQMLAISRALLQDPALLILDEPTEGLAPVIVDHVAQVLSDIAHEGDVAVLLVEQNLSVALDISNDIAVMVNGQIKHQMPSDTLRNDKNLQQQLMGVGRHAHDDTPMISGGKTMTKKSILVAGTYDTKADELNYIAELIGAAGVDCQRVDLSTSGSEAGVEISAQDIASAHPGGLDAVFTGDRGSAVAAMAVAFEAWVKNNAGEIGGIVSAAGSGGTALATPAMRALPVGCPKVMISTVASGDVSPYVGPSDIMMMYSVTDVQGLNAISRQVLGNGAAAMIGMAQNAPEVGASEADKPGLGLMMFGVTTPAVQAIAEGLEGQYEPFVFHATGVGGRSMEKLVDSGFLSAVIDLTTTEICDMMMGGVMAADEDRFGSVIRTKTPFVGSCGALDMVNFAAPSTIPDKYKDRLFYEHNPQVTLMRTTAEENAKMGTWIAARLNEMQGPVRFLIPEGGVSALDSKDLPFWDPIADKALFDAIEAGVKITENRKIIRVSHHINAPEFAAAAIAALKEIHA